MEASVIAGSAIVEEKALVAGSWLDVFCNQTHKWYPAKVIKEDREGDRVLVQFFGWSERCNQWVSKVRSVVVFLWPVTVTGWG